MKGTVRLATGAKREAAETDTRLLFFKRDSIAKQSPKASNFPLFVKSCRLLKALHIDAATIQNQPSPIVLSLFQLFGPF